MKIFISWSGTLSLRIAEVLNSWIPMVLQAVETFYSPDAIDKGQKWFNSVTTELESTNFGIICLTHENLQSPWIMFEASALSKSLQNSKVSPILFNVTPDEIQGPLKQLQATKFEKSDMRKLLLSINNSIPTERKLDQKKLDIIFDKWWGDLSEQIQEILKEDKHIKTSPVIGKSVEELLNEILELQTRSKFSDNISQVSFDTSVQFLIEQFSYHFLAEKYLIHVLDTGDMQRYLIQPIVDLLEKTSFDKGIKNELAKKLADVIVHIEDLTTKGAIVEPD
jgi:hypothetical protein